MKLDEYLATYEFHEIHTVTVNATLEQTFAALKELTFAELSPLVSLLLDIRNLPARLLGRENAHQLQDGPFLEQMYKNGFTPLAEEPDREIVFGTIGQFWKLTGVQEPRIPGPQAFLAFDDPAFAKVAANLRVTASEDGRTRCSTETRIHVPEPSTRRRFALYWGIISMGSALIRVLWLQAIKRRAERDSRSRASSTPQLGA